MRSETSASSVQARDGTSGMSGAPSFRGHLGDTITPGPRAHRVDLSGLRVFERSVRAIAWGLYKTLLYGSIATSRSHSRKSQTLQTTSQSLTPCPRKPSAPPSSPSSLTTVSVMLLAVPCILSLLSQALLSRSQVSCSAAGRLEWVRSRRRL
jgi:hypothetical protein